MCIYIYIYIYCLIIYIHIHQAYTKQMRNKWLNILAMSPSALSRCIDRRYDGPKHLRTRDYESDEELNRLNALMGLGLL